MRKPASPKTKPGVERNGTEMVRSCGDGQLPLCSYTPICKIAGGIGRSVLPPEADDQSESILSNRASQFQEVTAPRGAMSGPEIWSNSINVGMLKHLKIPAEFGVGLLTTLNP